MSKKDYDLIAGVFAGTRPNNGNTRLEDQWTFDVRAMADALAAANPKFQRDKFFKACEA